MTDSMNFVSWFLSEVPAFLMAEPICYFVGFIFLFVVIRLIRELIRIA